MLLYTTIAPYYGWIKMLTGKPRGFWRSLLAAKGADRALLVFALLYDVSPIDLIPGDVFTVIGLADDTTLTAAVLLYLRWKWARNDRRQAPELAATPPPDSPAPWSDNLDPWAELQGHDPNRWQDGTPNFGPNRWPTL